MVISMTGYGRATLEVDGLRAHVEINSVNSRYCEVNCRTPRSLNPHVSEMQKLAKDELERGKVNISVQFEEIGIEAATPNVDVSRVEAYSRMLDRIRTAAGIAEPIALEHVLKYADLFAPQEDPNAVSEKHWKVAHPAVLEALSALNDMREAEGAVLKDDMVARLESIESEVLHVEERSPDRVTEARERLKDRVASLISDEKVVEERIEQEIVLLADKLDVTEEVVRLRSHIDQFRVALDSEDSPGRKLNFLSQELNREINTIGSKANDSEITMYVVRMKEELEKIREQVQNIV